MPETVQLLLLLLQVFKIKAIYHTLNQFNMDVTQKCLIGECWCPVEDLEAIQVSLRRGTVSGRGLVMKGRV